MTGGRSLVGTEGYIELRKYIDPAGQPGANHLIVANQSGIQRYCLDGKIGHPFFDRLITDCLDRTESAMPQAHAFKAAELALHAQQIAVRLPPKPFHDKLPTTS